MIIPLYAQLLGAHVIAMIVGMGAVIVIDTFGLLWLLRRVELSMVMRVAEVTQKLIWIGWVSSVVTGTALLLQKGYVDELTIIKIGLVAALGINGIALHKLKHAMQRVRGNDVPWRLQFRIAITTIVSQFGWWGAIGIGFVHSHYNHEINYPSNPFAALGIGIAILACIVVLERVIARYVRNS